MSGTSSRKAASSGDASLIDQPGDFDSESRKCDANNFTGPIDDVLALVQNAFDKRVKISAKDMQFVDQKVHEMKNRIINKLLPIEKETVTKGKAKSVHNDCEFPRITDSQVLPSLQSGKTYASVIVKSEKEKKFETTEIRSMESKVNRMLSSENIEATIISSNSTKNGDCEIKFNKTDDVKSIAKKMENNLGLKAQSRPILIPKMTISYVPKYISLEESVTEQVVRSNKWLEEMVKSGEKIYVDPKHHKMAF